MTFEKGKPVFILEDAEGAPWVMRAWAMIVDLLLTYDSLKDLGSKLKFASVIPKITSRFFHPKSKLASRAR